MTIEQINKLNEALEVLADLAEKAPICYGDLCSIGLTAEETLERAQLVTMALNMVMAVRNEVAKRLQQSINAHEVITKTLNEANKVLQNSADIYLQDLQGGK